MTEPSAVVEAFLGTSHVMLVGGIIESFSRYENANGRVPVSLLRSFEFDDGRRPSLRPVDVWDRTRFLIPVAEEYRAAALWFVEQVHATHPALGLTGS